MPRIRPPSGGGTGSGAANPVDSTTAAYQCAAQTPSLARAPAGQASIWINGQLVSQSPFVGNANAGFHSPFNLGRRPGAFNDWFFAGNIDDVRVYNRPLTAAEITHLHNLERGITKSLDIDIEVLRLTLNVIPGRRYATSCGWLILLKSRSVTRGEVTASARVLKTQ